MVRPILAAIAGRGLAAQIRIDLIDLIPENWIVLNWSFPR
jgi:hypothetical protein